MRAQCQLKSCKMLHKCSTDCMWKRLQPVNDIQCHSRSLLLPPFDRPYTISYWSSIVSISVSWTVYKILTLICQKWRHHVTLTMPSWGTVMGPIRVQNLTTQFSAIPEKFKGVKNSKMDHVTRNMPLSGMVGRPKANNWDTQQAHKIWRCFSRSEDISRGVKF